MSAGQRWSDIRGVLPDIQIVGPATNVAGWAVTSSASSTPVIMSTEDIMSGYRLTEDYKRP